MLVALVAALSSVLVLVDFPTPLLFGGLFGGLVFALGSSRQVVAPRW